MESTNARRISKNRVCNNGRFLPVVRYLSAAVSLVGSMSALADGLTISGLVGAGPTYTSNIAGGARYAVDTAPNRPNYLAFNGSESLGADTSAYFRLSGRFLVDTGQLLGQLFNANSIVGIRGPAGDVSFGLMRDFMFEYLTAGGFSGAWHGGLWGASQGPFTNFGGVNIGPSPSSNFDYDRTNGEMSTNGVKYTNQFGPLKVGAMYAFGERPGSVTSGSTYSIGGLYQSGKFGATVAYTDFRDGSTPTSTAHIRVLGVGSKWNADRWTLAGTYTRSDNVNTGGVINNYGIGTTWSFAERYILTAHYQYMTGNAPLLDRYAHQLLLVAETALSKRSRLYFQGAYQWAGGQDAKAWINGATGQSSTSRQMIAGVYLEHRF
ncbi:porin [Cupriavidus consociatus]|uniref:porin n=1 Tax=Cupriavidus consociatus TaxID=2821357 RepID=UPI001AE27788|nr:MULTISPECIES: porin [unclassified Cupriavidus]MBP0623691.1 porin [Cupriavidus sp. LEh25]MDK2660395.1 porin [Cupriavidus sp. LEh21]